MSIGGHSPLGTLLIQRLDAALGNTLGQQSNISTGARPDAVSQPQHPERNQRSENTTSRHPQHSVEQATRHAQQGKQQQPRQDVGLNRQAAIESLLRHTSTAATKSAPTTLGKAAQTILQIIDRYPEIKQGLQGHHPLANNGDLRSLLQAALTQARAHTVSITSQAAQPATGQTNTDSTLARPLSATASLLQQLDTTALAQNFMKGLQQTVQHSGMFYEAQLARFAFGQGSLQTLLQQPQNQPANAQANTPQSTAQSTTHAETQNATNHPPHQAAAAADNSDSPHSLLLRQQLEVLANQQFQWRGEAWQNVPLDWLIQRKQQHEGSPNHKRTVSSQQWDSHLRMQLPLLGTVEVALTLVDKQLSLRISAPEGHDSLQPHLPALQDRLTTLGFSLQRLTMQEDTTSLPPSSDAHDG